MSSFQSTIGLVAGFLSIICVLPYIISTLQDKTKPHRITWWVLSLLGFMMALNQWLAGGGNTVWMPLCGAIGQMVLAILSIRHGEGGWGTLDRVCMMGVTTSGLILMCFQVPLLALLLNIGMDFLGFLPTLQKARRAPQTENLTCWSLYFLGSVLNLLAIDSWSSLEPILPLYLFFADGLIVIFLLGPYFRLLQAKPRLRRLINDYLPTPISLQVRLLRRIYNTMWHRIHTSDLYFRLHLVLVDERYDFSRFGTNTENVRRYHNAVPNHRNRGSQVQVAAVQPEYNHSLEWL